MDRSNEETIYVRLIDEVVFMARPVRAKRIDVGVYHIIDSQYYNTEVEEWEFVPGDTVRCEWVERESSGRGWLAVEKV